MADIIVTTPKSQMEVAAQEAQDCITAGGGCYFRDFGHNRPRKLNKGDRVFYVEDGFIRGFAVVRDIIQAGLIVCQTTGNEWYGCKVIMRAESWRWIKPIPMKGFRGYRYFEPPANMEIVGGWLDSKPEMVVA